MTRRILITNDYPRAAEGVAWLSRRRDYEIRTAIDASQTIALAEEFRPDIILLDIGLPDLSGFETAKRIRTQPWGKAVVLIAVSGRWDEKYEQLRREAGFDAHLIKRAAVREIVDLIEKLSPTES